MASWRAIVLMVLVVAEAMAGPDGVGTLGTVAEVASRRPVARARVVYQPRPAPARRLSDGGALEDLGRRRYADDHLWEPLRIRFFTEDLEHVDDREAIIEAVEAAGRHVSRMLRVRPVLGRLRFPRRCAAFNRLSKTCAQLAEGPRQCGLATIPSEHMAETKACKDGFDLVCSVSEGGSGIADADVAIYVASANSPACARLVGAYAEVCEQDQEDRPVAGFVNICPSSAPSLRGGWGAGVAMLAHELLHVLGVSSSLFAYFRDEGGEPLTARDEYGLPPLSPEGYPMADASTIRRQITESSELHYMVTPRVLAVGREYFGCPLLDGIPLEEGSSGEGSAFSHWNDRALKGEVMTPDMQANLVVSAFTLALLHDSGWYRPDYAQAGALTWGAQKGCSFLWNECVRDGQTGFPDTFCTQSAGKCSTQWDPAWGCTHDLRGKATCNLCEHGARLPPQFQYFSNPSLGGYAARMSYCPYWEARSDCTAPGAGRQAGETFGESSVCILANAMKAQAAAEGPRPTCRQVVCHEPGQGSLEVGRLSISIGRAWVNCSENESGMHKYVNSSDWQGSINCPAYSRLCGQGLASSVFFPSSAKCVFPGQLRDGRCVCSPGYFGSDCSERDAGEARAAHPHGLRYPSAELTLVMGAPLEQADDLTAWPFRPSLSDCPGEVYFSVSPTLPDGLTLSAFTGVLSGTPAVATPRSPYVFRAQGRGGAATAGVFIEVRCPGGTCPTASPAPSSGAFVNGTSRGALATDACRWGSGHRLRVVVARSFAEIQASGPAAFLEEATRALSAAAGGIVVEADLVLALPGCARLEASVLNDGGRPDANETFARAAQALLEEFGDEGSGLRRSAFGRRYLDEASQLFARSDDGLRQLWPAPDEEKPFWLQTLTSYWWVFAMAAAGYCCICACSCCRGKGRARRCCCGLRGQRTVADGEDPESALNTNDSPGVPVVVAVAVGGGSATTPLPVIVGVPVDTGRGEPLAKLLDMGFARGDAIAALEASGGDVAVAAARCAERA